MKTAWIWLAAVLAVAGIASAVPPSFSDTAAPEGWTVEDTERIRRALDKSIAAGGPEFQ